VAVPSFLPLFPRLISFIQPVTTVLKLSPAFSDLKACSSLPFLLSRGVISLALVGFASFVKAEAENVDAKEPEEVFDYYMFIWNIFYACYVILPLGAIK